MEYAINTTEVKFDVTVGGQGFVVDFSRMHPSYVAAHLRKAAQRFVNDSLTGMAGELPSVKADAARLAFAEIHSGLPMKVKERKAASPSQVDMARKIARDFATNELLEICKKNFPGKEKDWAVHPTVGKYFKTSEKGRVTFDMSEVDAYIERAKVRAKDARDFMALAQAQLDDAANLGDDLGDLDL